MHTHTNAASGYKFHGGNALILEKACEARGYTNPQWLTKAQADKLGLEPRPNAVPNQVILNERVFNVYNIDDMQQAAHTLAPEERYMTAGHADLQPSLPL